MLTQMNFSSDEYILYRSVELSDVVVIWKCNSFGRVINAAAQLYALEELVFIRKNTHNYLLNLQSVV